MIQLSSILLVDDDATQNFVNGRLLQRLGVTKQLLVAQNGKDALEVISKICLDPEEAELLPRLIFLDINMPVLNGFGFLQGFSELDCPGKESVIIIVLTTSSNPRDIETIKKAGVKEFINKPLTKESVIELVNKHFTE